VAGAVFNITNCIIGAGTIGLQWLPWYSSSCRILVFRQQQLARPKGNRVEKKWTHRMQLIHTGTLILHSYRSSNRWKACTRFTENVKGCDVSKCHHYFGLLLKWEMLCHYVQR
jgi:hypothetical protein